MSDHNGSFYFELVNAWASLYVSINPLFLGHPCNYLKHVRGTTPRADKTRIGVYNFRITGDTTAFLDFSPT